jgi:hypothetical protein
MAGLHVIELLGQGSDLPALVNVWEVKPVGSTKLRLWTMGEEADRLGRGPRVDRGLGPDEVR